MNWTTRFRLVAWVLFSATVIVGLVGWGLGKDPGQLGTVLGYVTLAAGIGESSNVGKRATYKPEAV